MEQTPLLPKVMKVVRFAEKLMTSITTLPGTRDPKRFFKGTLLFFVVRACQTMRAIQALLRRGFSDQAMTLGRTVVEMGLNAEYIGRAPEERGRRFMEFDFVLRKKWLETVKKHKDRFSFPVPPPEVIREIEEGYARVQRQFKRKDTWSDRSIRQMSIEGDVEWIYDIVYAFCCESSHNAVRKMKDYFKEVPGQRMQVNLGPNPYYHDAALTGAVTGLFMILTHLDTQYGLGRQKQIETLSASL